MGIGLRAWFLIDNGIDMTALRLLVSNHYHQIYAVSGNLSYRHVFRVRSDMKREYLPVETLPAWAKLNGISLAGVAFGRLQAEDGTDKGCAIVATEEKINESESNPEILLKMPSDLVLSLETVHNYAKADGYLREVLEAAGDFGRVCFHIPSLKNEIVLHSSPLN